jgi:A/G-specific adenine glycosylase
MKAWQGLGYYSRAKNLHHTAIYISKELKGNFPDEFENIKKLKGIGDYTAGAIASIAFNKPHAVVDGNVFRVLSRYFGIKTPVDSIVGKRVFARKAAKLLDLKNPGTYNQAVMEFGALQCVPVNPDCTRCVLKKSCKAFLKRQVDQLPVKIKKVKTRTRYFNYLVIRDKGKIQIRKRTGKDIWQHLYDFPMIETKQALTINKMQKLVPVPIKSSSKSYKHVLSHQVILAQFWEMEHSKKLVGSAFEKTIYVTENQLNKFAFPRLIERYLNEKTAGI